MSTEGFGALLVLMLAVSYSCEALVGRNKRVNHEHKDKTNFLHALRGFVQQRQEHLHVEERANLNRGLTPQQKQRVVDFHNQLRRGENAADMEKIVWNDQLAEMAQQWSDRCEFVHRDASPAGTYDAASYGFGNIGENMWVGFGESAPIPNRPIQSWFDEKSNYDYSSSFCMRDVCGHYTQVVRATSKEVGCGFTKCSSMRMPGQASRQNAEFFVCNYGPGDNYPDKQPFKLGQPCTACASGKFFCTNKLCDSTCSRPGSGQECQCKASCKNCGRKTNECSCQCKPGYSGVTCDKPCEDVDPKCNPRPGQMGWPASFCTYSDPSFRQQVIEGCPKMCGTCVPGDGTPCRTSKSIYHEMFDNE